MLVIVDLDGKHLLKASEATLDRIRSPALLS
jgi:hypothetical protein